MMKSVRISTPPVTDSDFNMIIYKTTNLINGKFYIGQDSKNNPDYLGSGLLLNRAIEKYGIENFKKETLEVCKNKKHLNERERYWIEETKAKEIGYNIADGGHGGNTYTEETKQRISKLFTNRHISEETIQKRKLTRAKNPEKYKLSEERKKLIGDQHRGKTLSEEHKQAISNYMKNSAIYSEEFLSMQNGENKKGENSPSWGKKASDETRKKQSEAHKKNPTRFWLGKKQPKEMVEKRTRNQKGSKWSEERRKKYEEKGNSFSGKKHSKESLDKMKIAAQNKTPEQKLETYVKFHISRFGYEPSEDKKIAKLNHYKESQKC